MKFAAYTPSTKPQTEKEKQALIGRAAKMLTAQHNFVVDVSRGEKEPNDETGDRLIAAAIQELIDEVKAIYPDGPNLLRDDIIALPTLIGGHTKLLVEKPSEVVH